MGEVVHLGCETTLDIPPENVLGAAMDADLSSVVVVGYDPDGFLYFAGSPGSKPETLWLLQRAIHQLMVEVGTCD